jgi:hypothetical protein
MVNACATLWRHRRNADRGESPDRQSMEKGQARGAEPPFQPLRPGNRIAAPHNII